MNDATPPPDADLASAALDGELTETERATLNSSPAIAERVSLYTDLRRQLVDVAVPPGRRDEAVTAALTVFDAAMVRPVVSLRARHQSRYRWIGGAAAAALIAVIAVGVARNLGSDGNEKSTAALRAPGTDAKFSAGSSPAASTEAEPGAPASTAGAATQSADAAAPAPPLEINSAATVSPWYNAPILGTVEEMRAFVASEAFDRAGVAGPDPATVTSADKTARCELFNGGQVAPAIYQGQQVYVVRDDANRQIVVVEPAGCVAVATIAMS